MSEEIVKKRRYTWKIDPSARDGVTIDYIVEEEE